MKGERIVMTFVLLCIACCAACVASVGPSYQTPFALLVIDNQRTDAEWIYLERDGSKGRKLGRVEALTTDTLVLREGDLSAGAAFTLDAISFGLSYVDKSDNITAARGTVYRWQLAPQRGMSFITARSAD